MSLVQQVINLAQVIKTDINGIRTDLGNKANLTTTDKTSLVNALNEVLGKVNNLIDDTAGAGITDKVWSADKTVAYVQQVKSQILGGTIPEASDSLLELLTLINDDQNELNTIFLALDKRVSVDSIQTFSEAQQLQARQNIGAASDAEFQQFKIEVGDTNADFVAAYNSF